MSMHINALALEFKMKELWIESLPWCCGTTRALVVSFARGAPGCLETALHTVDAKYSSICPAYSSTFKGT